MRGEVGDGGQRRSCCYFIMEENPRGQVES